MLSYDPTAPETLADPYKVYARLRDEAPAYYIESWDCWALSRFSDIWQYSNSHEHFSARFGTAPPYFLGNTLSPGVNLNHMDPPEHMPLRTELLQHFLPPVMKTMRAGIAAIVDEVTDPLLEQGTAEAFDELGQSSATRVASRVIGFPTDDEAYIRDFLARIFKSIGGAEGTEQMAATAFSDMRHYLTAQAAARRDYTGAPENLIDTLYRCLGTELSDADMGEHLMPLFFGATETFPKLSSAALYRLWKHPDQRALLVAEPALIPSAVRECLRFDMPTQMSMRKIVADIELHGQRLEEGSAVMFLWASGNRDEREFEDPNRFDISRHIRRSLSFGHGIHRCLGANLAELLLRKVLAAVPQYEVDEEQVRFESTTFFNAFTHMPLDMSRH